MIKNTEMLLDELVQNENNPRQITDERFQKLILSILAFPKMLKMRPIVIDTAKKILGGNMRFLSLCEILKFSDSTLMEKIALLKKPKAEQDELLKYWQAWRNNQKITVILADDLDEDEKREFIIKDNNEFGRWDWEMLSNDWDVSQLSDWGIDLPLTDEINPDEFFESINDTQNTQNIKLAVHIPGELAEQKDAIKSAIETALADYSGIKVK